MPDHKRDVKATIIVPAFNESAVIHKVLKSIPRRVKGLSRVQVVVIDDGSTDETAQEAQKANVAIVSHSINRGLGAAIKTGIEWVKLNGSDIAVTFDSDGQHYPKDIHKIIKSLITQKADLVIGTRFALKQKIPKDRKVLNWLANIATLLIFGVSSTDSQSGLRAFSKKAIDLIDFKGERMDFSSEILHEAKRHHLLVKEVPIKAIYTSYSRKKGQKNLNAIPILIRFLVRFLR